MVSKRLPLSPLSVVLRKDDFEADRGVEFMKREHKAWGANDADSGKPKSCLSPSATLSTTNPT
jgi:hypothetical protein